MARRKDSPDYSDEQLRKDTELLGEIDYGEVVTNTETPRSSTRTSRTTTGTRRPRAAKLTALTDEIAGEIALVGAMAAAVAPTTGYVLVEDSGPAAKALIRLAQDRPWAIKALERAAQIGAGAELGKISLRVLTAAAVDVGRMDYDAMLPQMLRVTPAYLATHDTESAPANTFAGQATAPRFVPG